MKVNVIKNNFYLLKICFASSPGYIILLFVNAIIQPFVVFVEHVYTIQYVLNIIEFHKPYLDAVYMILFTIVLVSLKLLFAGIMEQRITPAAVPKLIRDVRKSLYEKAKNIDLACYDDPEYYNQFVLSINESDKCVNRLIQSIEMIIKGITGTILAGTFFITIDMWALVFVLVPFVFNIFLSNKINKINFRMKIEKIFLERKRIYLHRVFYLHDFAKDLRLYPQIKQTISKEFEETNDKIYKTEKKYIRKKWILGFIKEYLGNNFIIDVLFVLYLLFKTIVLKTLSFSNMVVLYNSSRDFKNTLLHISEGLPILSENVLYIEKMKTFLEYQSKIISEENLPVPKTPKTLELRDVSFSYNSTSESIINHINLKIEALDKVALVGYNGAGKTTLIKLIMRLYDPTEGEILLDGINIKKYNLDDYRRQIGVVFQDFKIYAASIKENVLLGETEADDVVLPALKKCGFDNKLNTLTEGIDTQLTTEFKKEGINLSGGEGQKIAIARTLLRKNNIVILDEPSSALDPVAEYQLNNLMFDVSREKSIIFISHRLSTTKRSDYILMMEHGKIIEQGSHQDLLFQNGKYAKMWYAQANQYKSLRMPQNK